MALQFLFHRFEFGPLKGEEAHDTKSFFFQNTRVGNILVAISSFKLQFSTSTAPDRKLEERHFGREHIETAVNLTALNPNGTELDLIVKTFLIRDATGDIDDPYEGFVDVQLLVETA
jgi:hypothetical protein